ncbi:FHA domain-containing protein [Nostocoides sp. F2B08]|uniref:FtsK/SpoIIIE domain-containing protein n=1 Tax=Nostocoides sp. F2B08 TaxID=2653936 RepID=UPI001262CF50|nr:FtsK/SpoIIIE domain-containing protein [Tetrasphaera sp. F2B08]KAB7741832.1 FHA domain-containing protein [Tetrasphaera sp. F2B08]
MRIRLTVRTGADPAAHEVVVETPETATADLRTDRVAARLATTLGVPGDALAVSGRLLDDGAPLGSPPLLDGTSVRLVERESWVEPRRSRSAAVELAVASGPDAGRTRALTPGAHTVGRVGADLCIADPPLSRLHLRVDVGADGLTVTDLGSENGTLVDGHPVDEPVPVATGSVMTLGRTTLQVRPSRVAPAAAIVRGDGTLLVSRAASPPPVHREGRVELPRPPDSPPARRVPWVAALVPLPVAGVLALLFGPHLLVLAVMSPLMLLGGYLSDRIGSRRTHAQALADHASARATGLARTDTALAAERAWLERTHPDPAAVMRTASGPGSTIWSRTRPLRVRLGRGTVDSTVTVAEDGAASRLPLADAPVVLDLDAAGVTAVCGALAGAAADAVVGQLLVLHPPRELHLWTDRAGWTRAPHTRAGSPEELLVDAASTVRGRVDGGGHAWNSPGGPAVIVVVDGRALSAQAHEALTVLVEHGPAAGVAALVVGAALPGAPVSVAICDGGTAVLRRPAAPDLPLIVDAVDPDWVARVVAGLTPLRDGAGDAGLPNRLALATVLDPTDIRARWSDPGDGAVVTLGVAGRGHLAVDLATAGPHVLVGGTTGSGKSELLRTMVVSLAAAHAPEDAAVVLVDYKGGSAFAGLERLPHIVGVVTDLDPALTTRALTSLRAEIHRRESLLAGCGAADILAYRSASRRSPETLPHLARLVIVVDEFRALADELPEFVTGLVRLAAVGRSLGIHLVLATQRPAGVVSADMRANLGLRIALRVRDRGDSQDVIESDAAARLPRSVPGRALLRWGGEPLVELQTASVADPSDIAHQHVAVHWSDGTATTRTFPLEDSAPPTDLVATIAATALRQGRTAPPSPWLPPLPDRVGLDDGDPDSAWALVDEPTVQRQSLEELDLATQPHIAVSGAVGSGRSQTALSLASAALATRGATTHVATVADPTGPLGRLDGLPHAVGVVDRSAPADVAWFVDRLCEEVARRRSAGWTHHLLVVVDGWDVLTETCDVLDHGALTDRLLAALRDGHALGVRAVLTGDRSVLTGRVARTAEQRFLLRPADPTDLAIAGVSHSVAPGHWPNGRLLRAADGVQLQVVLRAPSDRPAVPPVEPPWRVRRLPPRVDLHALPSVTGALVLGRTADDGLLTVGEPGRRRLLVVGSAGSGRTDTLAAIAHQADRQGRRVCVLGDLHSPLGERLQTTGVCVDRLGWDAHDDLVRLRRTHPDLVVLADDVDRAPDGAAARAVTEMADLAERDGGLVAVSGDAAALAMRTRGIGAAVGRGRVGLVLGAPTPLDADLLGVRLPRIREVVPGRGWLVADRRAVPVQVAEHTSHASVTPVMPRS